MTPMPIFPLSGVRILDFSTQMACPYGATLLALMGAEVIKVESRRYLDSGRRPASRSIDPAVINMVPRFNDNNLSKQSVTVDLTNPDAQDIVRGLLRISDVAMANMRPGKMDKLGLGYADMRRERPDIIVLSLSSMGGRGPERQYAGYAAIFAALSGLSDATGYVGGMPTEGRATIDASAATTVAFSVAAALFHRKRTGEGQHIDLSARESIGSLLGEMYLDHAMNGRNPARKGNEDDVMAPHNVYPCMDKDSWVSIAVGSEREWQAFCRVLGRPEWITDVRFADPHVRWKNRAALDSAIAEWTRTRKPYDVMHALQNAGVAAMPSMSSKDLFTDPHSQARGIYKEFQHKALGKRTVIGPQWKLSATPLDTVKPAPLFGEHNGVVFEELLGVRRETVQEKGKSKAIY